MSIQNLRTRIFAASFLVCSLHTVYNSAQTPPNGALCQLDATDPKNTGHFSCVLLWRLQGKPEISPEILENNLEIYFSGLTASLAKSLHIPANKIIDTEAALKKVPALTGDRETYTGKIHLLDFFSYKSTALNVIIHVLNTLSTEYIPVRLEISQKDFTDSIWHELYELNVNFNPII